KSFTENQVVDFAKSDLNEVGQSLNDADRMAVLGRFDDEVNADKQAVIDNSVAEKFNNQFDRYEALHKDLDDHRNARNEVVNYTYVHNHTTPDPDVYEKSTPEVREAVIANLAENMTADAKQVLTENNIDKEQVERIAEFIETDIRDRAAIDAD